MYPHPTFPWITNLQVLLHSLMGMPGSPLSLLLPGVFKPFYSFQANLENIWRLKQKLVWKCQNISCGVPKMKSLRNIQPLVLNSFQEWWSLTFYREMDFYSP